MRMMNPKQIYEFLTNFQLIIKILLMANHIR